MCAMDYVRELTEAHEKLAHRLAQRDIQRSTFLAAAISGNYAVLRWLEKDYEAGERDLVDDWWSRR